MADFEETEELVEEVEEVETSEEVEEVEEIESEEVQNVVELEGDSEDIEDSEEESEDIEEIEDAEDVNESFINRLKNVLMGTAKEPVQDAIDYKAKYEAILEENDQLAELANGQQERIEELEAQKTDLEVSLKELSHVRDQARMALATKPKRAVG